MRLNRDGGIDLGEGLEERVRKTVKICSASQKEMKEFRKMSEDDKEFYEDDIAIHRKVLAAYAKLTAARRDLKKLVESYEFTELVVWESDTESAGYRGLELRADEILKDIVWATYRLELIIEDEMLDLDG